MIFGFQAARSRVLGPGGDRRGDHKQGQRGKRVQSPAAQPSGTGVAPGTAAHALLQAVAHAFE